MINTQIAQALNILIPAGNWGSFTGDATTEAEYLAQFNYTGQGTMPTWTQVQAVVLP